MKNNYFIKAVLMCTVGVSGFNLQGQCANPANIYSFNYNGKTYQVVKENKNWIGAAACAVEKGGILAEINSQDEQDAVFAGLQSAGVSLLNTTAPDGGGSSYIWIGGNDMAEEGKWIWDGNNDGVGPQFWQGDFAGSSVGDLYENWGGEPDNYNSNQNALGLALTDWIYGDAGEWNDLFQGNLLYFVIEYDSILGTKDAISEPGSAWLYPNPVRDFLEIKATKNIVGITLTDVSGRQLRSFSVNNKHHEKIDCTSLADGFYFIEIMYQDNTSAKHKIIKSAK